MLMAGFRGLAVEATDTVAVDISERHLGGVVLFDYHVPANSPVRNIESPEQVGALVASLQSLAPTPLLVAIDQEGGRVSRLKESFGFPPTVSAQYLGEIDDLSLTFSEAAATAATLAGLGINLNLAPVVDLNTNPANPVIGGLERSFSADPAVVEAHALEVIGAHGEVGALTALKHFPGHGSSTADSHLGFVDVTDTWTSEELLPYQGIIAAGQADMVMTAHVFNEALDPHVPATLSNATISGLLRGELGYQGVVISDDMQMGAITEHYGFETAVEAAILAGVDILVFANNSVYEEDAIARAISFILDLVGSGRVSEARIDESYERIITLKRSL
ncbi:MAG: glycoside hydrolase family 3 [Dehalococcoidia bacterium]|nr:glycoside hydrolase family 3 [Dehalococcoidia bacterium]